MSNTNTDRTAGEREKAIEAWHSDIAGAVTRYVLAALRRNKDQSTTSKEAVDDALAAVHEAYDKGQLLMRTAPATAEGELVARAKAWSPADEPVVQSFCFESSGFDVCGKAKPCSEHEPAESSCGCRPSNTECGCCMRHRMVGDGCQFCQPKEERRDDN